MCCPIKFGKNSCLGVIECANKIESQFSIKDKVLVESIATEIASGISNYIYNAKKNNAKEEWKECDQLKDNYSKPILRSVLLVLADYCKAERVVLQLNSGTTDPQPMLYHLTSIIHCKGEKEECSNLLSLVL